MEGGGRACVALCRAGLKQVVHVSFVPLPRVQLVIFISHKCCSLYLQRKKPAKLTWTLAWRRMNKKVTQLVKSKGGARQRGGKIARGINGLSAEEIAKRRALTTDGKLKFSQKQAALKAKRRTTAGKA